MSLSKTLLFRRLQWLSLFVLTFALSSAAPLAVKICVPYKEGSSGSFREKCTLAVGAANTDDLAFECVEGGSADECIAQLESGDAHLTTLDGSDVLRANNDHGIVPLIAESTGNDVPGGTYYAVAVVNKEFCTAKTTLADLKGVRSCHTGYRKSAGWKIPVGTLLNNVVGFQSVTSDPEVEDDAELVAEFFSETCAPRTTENGPLNTENGEGSLWEDLCTGCKGDCTTSDQYYDYSGAFRCLMEDNGDVAFVKHTTVLEYAQDGTSEEVKRAWADKEAGDFQLLCVDGGCKDVTDFEDCHLALAPGHALVTSKELGYEGEDAETGVAIQAAILEAAEDSDFLENSVGLATNFLWSEGTTGLKAIEKGMEDYLPAESVEAFLAFDQLTEAASRTTPTAIYCATSDEELAFCESMWEVARDAVEVFKWGCAQKANAAACMKAIADGEADWMTVDGRGAYVAHSEYGLTTVFAESGALGDGYDSYSVAVVHKDFCEENEDALLIDLKGKNSCHPGYKHLVGWDVAVGKMVAIGAMEAVKDDPLVENDAETVAAFFEESCAPNNAGDGPQRTPRGGSEAWPPLCGGCKMSCDEKSPYFGEEGAHKCLAAGDGDVAFVKHSTIVEFDDEEEIGDLRLVCASLAGCAAVDEYESCNLGLVPARSVVTRDDSTYKESFQQVLTNLTAEFEFEELVLEEKSNPANLIFNAGAEFVELNNGTEAFLESSFSAFKALEELAAPGATIVKVCIPFQAGDTQRLECQRIFEAANITGLSFYCVEGGTAETCMQMLYAGEADLTTIDGGDVVRAHHAFGLIPLVREIGEDGREGSYYSVAVVNADFCDDESSLADLEGVRSCHTGYRKMAGWRIPVGTLYSQVEAFDQSVSKSDIENDAELVAKFFDTTCAPRASGNGPKNTEDGKGEIWEKLCEGCKGNCLTNDQYYDYDGAFRCLMEDSGDVAFVKHTTVLEYALDGTAEEVKRAWATKPASDFKLLCKTGGCADVEDFEDCHLALAPSHAIVGAPTLGAGGSLWDIGKAIQDGLVAAVDNPRFFDKARGFIADFPLSGSVQTLKAIEGGWEGYITPEADEALDAFSDLIEGDRQFNPGTLATFCTSTPEQLAACEENVKSLYIELEPNLDWACREENSTEACYASLQKGTSQFMVASPREALEGFISYNLTAIAAEAVGAERETFVYSLMVVDAASCRDKIYISNMEIEAACFPSYGSASGWETPIGVMITQGFLSPVEETEESSKAIQGVSDFFGKVCAPHDPESEAASKTLCEACEDDCDLDGEFSGAAGAIACMQQEEGRIAVTDSSILEDEDLTEGLQLLCPYKRECQDLDAASTCNFGTTLTDVILVLDTSDSSYVARLRSVLIDASSEKGYTSILGNTRDKGELVSVIGSTDVHLADYSLTEQLLSDFEG